MNPWIGWSLAAVAAALAWHQMGWKGLVIAVSVTVFWLLLQFSRAVRAMKEAGAAPIGFVHSAVMLHARLKAGMTLLQVIGLTRSLGQRLDEEGVQPERWRWTDEGGAAVTVELMDGKVRHWTLDRPAGVAQAVPSSGAITAPVPPPGPVSPGSAAE
jgi:hypothetical protein